MVSGENRAASPSQGHRDPDSLRAARATFPYGLDPKDTNIRIAPSFPTPEEMSAAADVFVLCVKLVSVEKLLSDM